MKRNTLIIACLFAFVAATFTVGCRKMCERCGHVIKVTVLEGVNFDFNKATLKPEGKAILDKDALLLSEDGTLDVSIEGHCDIVGSDEYNQKLSEARARSVFEYFLSK
nr:OmpA family protein [bacterium]